MQIRMHCAKATQRFLKQTDPVTKQTVQGVVHDVNLQIATTAGTPGGAGGLTHPDNVKAFLGSHGGEVNLIACNMPFVCGKEYRVTIEEIADPAPTE